MARDGNGRAPLQVTANLKAGQVPVEVARLLLEHDVNVESKKDKGFDNPAFIVGGMSLGVAASDDNT
jgi:hypothetical protein